MSTTKNFKSYKGMPTQIKARAEGKWDYRNYIVYNTENQNISVNMDNYNGLSAEYLESYQSADKYDFSNTVLPWKWQYSTALSTKKYCLMPVNGGQDVTIYIVNGTIVGSPTLDALTGVMSEFSTSNYLLLANMKTYSVGTISSMEMVFKIHTPTEGNWTSNGRIINSTVAFDDISLDINQNRPCFCFINADYSNNKTVQVAPANMASDTDYWIKVTYDGTDSKGFYSLDGENYTLQDTVTHDSSDLFVGSNFSIGNRIYDNYAGCVWNGSIDLSESYIKVNDETWWTGATFTTYHNMYKNITESDYEYNFNITGSPIINNQTKVVSGFSTTSCLTLNNMTSYTTSTITSLEMIFKIHTPVSGNWTSNGRIINGSAAYDDFSLDINSERAQFTFINSDTSTDKFLQLASNLSNDTDYWLKVTYDGTDLKGFYSIDGVDYIQTDSIARSSSELYLNAGYSIGSRSYDNLSICVWNGSIDLSESYIKVNNVNWWVPEFTKGLKTIAGDYTIVGSLTITDDVVSGFSTSNYINTDDFFKPSDSPFDIYFKIKTGNDVSTLQFFLGNGGYYDRCWSGIENGHLQWNLNNTSAYGANIGTIISTYTVLQNTTYWIHLKFDTAKYELYYSTDGINYILDGSLTTNTTISDVNYPLSIGANKFYNGVNYPFLGLIDLSETYIKIDGVDWWTGVDVATETLPGCTYNYTDDGSATTLNCFVINNDESIVLTPDNSYTNGYLLGTVSIPAHDVYTYNNGVWTQVPLSTTLHQYDRVDNKATVVGFFTDGNGQRYAVCVADAAYRIGRKYWSNSVGNTSLPDYTSQSTALTATESSTWNMDTIRNGNDLSSFPAFNSAYSKTIEHSGVIYRGLLPNAAELQMIWSNRVALDGYDPTLVDYPTNSLSSWNIGGGSANCWSSTESSSQNVWYLNSSGSWDNYYNKLNSFGIITVFEIPVDENGTVITS